MKLGIIKERKSPPDRRTVLTPHGMTLLKEKYPQLEVKVEHSDVRYFTDQEYEALGHEVAQDMTDCDVLVGIKEVPVDALIPNKSYFFFSHTIKKQPHNKKLLQAILEKNIDLYDFEMVVDQENKRLIGFGVDAGMVGTYNAMRAFGLKFELFQLPKASELSGKEAMIQRLKRLLLPPIKILVTGNGRVASGIKEIVNKMKIKSVSVDDFLTKKYTSPVYTQVQSGDYHVHRQHKNFDKNDFYTHPTQYESDFSKFSKVADILITGHLYPNSDFPVILTREMLRAKDCTLKVIADVTCDINASIASTIRSSTIAEPFYGYYPKEGKEVDLFHPAAVVVMAVDNLPCEIPKEASERFQEVFIQRLIPAFFNGDEEGILQRAKITEQGKLTKRFAYLQDFVDQI